MSVSKMQIFFVGTINLITGIISCVSLNELFYLLEDKGFGIFNYCPIYMAIGFITFFTLFYALYFYLMLFHYILCQFITNNDNIGGPGFSICGCIFLAMSAASYLYVLQLTTSNNLCYEVVNNKLFRSTINLNLINPGIIVFGLLIIKIINYFCIKNKNDEKTYNNLDNV